jgi:hypothetical protein
MIKNFSTANLREVFAEENKYENFRRVASNLVRGIDTYELDDEGNERRVSPADANKAIQKVFMNVCGLTEDDLRSQKRVRRARKAHEPEIFEIIEEDFDFVINEGFQNNEWFSAFVEMKSHALGDANAFIMPEENQYLIVGDVSGDHHDVTMQQLAQGEEFPVRCTSHAVKIGKDIDLIILGRYDYSKMVNKVAEAFVKNVQNGIFADVYAASAKLPASMKKTGALTSATKTNFDTLIENVEMVNDSAVVIMGTKTALKKITALADVDWATNEQKAQIVATGRLGAYEGTTLIEVPQRLKVGADLATIDNTDLLLPNDKLLIMPVREDKFVKFFDEGETEIFEITDKAALKDDFQTYEVHRSYGHEIILGQYFGEWTIE